MWWTRLSLAAHSLRAHSLRTLLTVASIAIGCFGIVAMTSLAESGLSTLARSIEDMGGARLLLFEAKPPERQEDRVGAYRHGLTLQDRDRAFSDLPGVLGVSLTAVLGARDVESDAGKSASTDLVAADAAFFRLYRMRVAKGRAFDEAENGRHAGVCVLGHRLSEKLFDGPALGHWLTIGRLRCRVVGVFADNDRFGLNFGFDWTDLLVVPRESAADVLPEAREGAGILVKTDLPAHNELVKRIANARLSERHHGLDDFTIYDFSSTMDRFASTFAILEVLVGLIAGVALVIGGVGVMNMMLVSVLERVREIGVKKALGARSRDVVLEFLTEASLLSAAGGALGVIAGAAAAALAGRLIVLALPSWVSVVSGTAAAVALCVSLAVGLVFGWIPARRASRLAPVEAMRR
jgi:putative ABC transport system permease protein